MSKQERIAVIGLGYVGLPVAVAFARAFPGTIGFDVNAARVEGLRAGNDVTGELDREVLEAIDLQLTNDPAALEDISFFVVAVPTPIDAGRRPDLTAVKAASRTVGSALKPGAVVVYESTVYPGVTEEVCGPLLEEVSGLKRGTDFTLGYSPERINPGDREHTLERIVKVVSGEDAATLERVAAAYETVVTAGVHRAPSIKVAEAAKVIENTQRDLNIALMNELAMIFDRMHIPTLDVIEAAATKWNFLRFTPGLVGGHCIGVDPYYLTAKAEELGYHPQVILSGRRINDGMGAFVAQKLVKLLIEHGRQVKGAKVVVSGLTFKEDVPDLRNSRVPDILDELRTFGVEPLVHDPLADAAEARAEYGVELTALDDVGELDALVIAVPHKATLDQLERLLGKVRPDGVVIDVKTAIKPEQVGDRVLWAL
jgi:UDP-N-acetyl-D-galactosamine dehydrogenase